MYYHTVPLLGDRVGFVFLLEIILFRNCRKKKIPEILCLALIHRVEQDL